ncbi:hypothetical protein EMIT0P258_30026 [Pseudomonas sp. IT-P258]
MSLGRYEFCSTAVDIRWADFPPDRADGPRLLLRKPSFNHRPQAIMADTEVHHAYGKNRAAKPGKGSMRI